MKKWLSSIAVLAITLSLAGCTEALDQKDTVVLETNSGVIKIQLWHDIAPKAAENFLKLAESGYYNAVVFHRVIPGFMIQSGDPSGTGSGGESIWGGAFEDEVFEGVSFDRPGLVAMANAGPNTNRSQFFITTAETPWLNMKHTIFGEVVEGYDVVALIEQSETNAKNRPIDTQQIIKAYSE